MTQLQFALYRTFHIALNGEEIPPPETLRSRALLTFLLLNPAPSTSRRAITALLWPELDEERASSAIRQNIYLLRRWLEAYLGTAEILKTRGNAIGLDRSTLQVDVLLLEQALTAQQRHQHRNPASCSTCLQLLEQALDVFRPLDPPRETYAEDGFEQWLDQRLATIPGSFGHAAAQLIAAALRMNRLAHAEQLARSWIAFEPYAEPAHRALATCLARSDRRASAIQHLRQFGRQLELEFGAAPEPETRHLIAQLTGASAAVRQPQFFQPPTLPGPVVGRESELARLAQLFAQPQVRLVTISGIGGIGKTSLALLAAHRFAAEFEHGVLVVPLVGITTIDDAALAVAAAVGTELTGSEALPAQLALTISELNLLLVLDNLEQLHDVHHLIDSLQRDAPHVLILATSRRPLDHLREHSLPLGGLALELPPGTPTADPPVAPAAEPTLPAAVRLFFQIAAYHLVDTSALDRTSVTAICQALGGHPLAITLAAHQLQHTGLSQLHEMLKPSRIPDFGTPHGSELRHQTILIIIQESLANLQPATVHLISTAALFTDIISAAALVAVADLPASAAAGALRQARNAGLLEFSAAETYRLHPLIRLAGTTADETAGFRFATYHLQLVNTAELDFVNADARTWDSTHHPVLRDIAHAVDLALDQQQFTLITTVAFRLATLAVLHGQQRNTIAQFQRAAARLADDVNPAAQACRQRLASTAIWLHLTVLDAESALREADLRLADPSLPHGSLDWLLIRRCRISALLYARQLDQAGADLDDLDHTQPLPPDLSEVAPIALTDSTGLRGRLALYRGDFASAIPLLRQAARSRATVGDQRGEMSFLNELAWATFAGGDRTTTLTILEETVSRARLTGDRASIAVTVANCGSVRLELGTDIARAELELMESLDLCRDLGLRQYRRSPLYGIITLHHRRRDFSAMLAPCREFLTLELQLGIRPIGLQVLKLLAESLLLTRPLLAADLLDLAAQHPLADAALQSDVARLFGDLPAGRRSIINPTDVITTLQRLLDLLP